MDELASKLGLSEEKRDGSRMESSQNRDSAPVRGRPSLNEPAVPQGVSSTGPNVVASESDVQHPTLGRPRSAGRKRPPTRAVITVPSSFSSEDDGFSPSPSFPSPSARTEATVEKAHVIVAANSKVSSVPLNSSSPSPSSSSTKKSSSLFGDDSNLNTTLKTESVSPVPASTTSISNRLTNSDLNLNDNTSVPISTQTKKSSGTSLFSVGDEDEDDLVRVSVFFLSLHSIFSVCSGLLVI